MAAVTGVVGNPYAFSTPAGFQNGSTVEALYCVVPVTFTGTYVQGTGYSITAAAIATAIQNSRRDGGTVTVDSVSPVQPGMEGASTVQFAGPSTPAGGPPATSWTGLLYGSDHTTERAASAMTAYTNPVPFAVGYRTTAT